MLPKNKRIKRATFSLLLNGAKILKNDLFLLKFVFGAEENSQFSFSVSKKVSKSAVVRNRLRRAGYRLLAKYIDQINPNVLANFSFKSIPKNDEYMEKSLKNILIDSKLIK
jgi:ribonuclease P protein component